MTVRVGVDSAAPGALDDEVSTDEDTEVLVDVRANDIDPDGDALQNPRITAPPGRGVARVRADGTVSYTPRENVNGTDIFTYEVCDVVGLCASATVVVSIAPVDDAPSAEDDNAATAVDTAVSVDVIANDVEPDGEALTIRLGDAAPANGTVALDGDNVVYTPASGFVGRDAFTYTVWRSARQLP